jgi:hypothetical protein
MPDEDFSGFGDLDTEQDRSWVVQDRFFMKRKYLNTGNGKNFLAGSLVDQHYYFDELENRVQFPAMFPVALLSCALLEKAGRRTICSKPIQWFMPVTSLAWIDGYRRT